MMDHRNAFVEPFLFGALKGRRDGCIGRSWQGVPKSSSWDYDDNCFHEVYGFTSNVFFP